MTLPILFGYVVMLSCFQYIWCTFTRGSERCD